MSKPLEFEKQEEYKNRLQALGELRDYGIEPYPHSYTPAHDAASLHNTYKDQEIGHSEQAATGKTPEVCLAGRMVLFRAMGKNAFAHLQDHTGRIQVMFNRDLTELFPKPDSKSDAETLSAIKIVEKMFDLGDILGIKGHLFYTQKGELTVFVKQVTLLCKTLLPLAEKHSGLQDKEIRYRERWLDLISNEDVRDTFRKRSKILSMVRSFFEEKEFIEVETPVLQSIYGGAEASPFITKLNALNQQMFLRISLEIPLKKLIVGGMHKVFEIGRVFRNEGIDRSHNPEFTLLEAYASYWDYNDMMHCMETLVESLAIALHGTTKLQITNPETNEEVVIDVKAPWPRLSMKESLIKFANINVEQMNDEELYQKVLSCGHLDPKKIKTFPRGLMIAALFEHFVEPQLIQPHHITDHPIETTPLCKPHRNKKEREDGIVERFESFILGGEFCNAYTELNDPVIQKKLLEEQAMRKEAGDEEANPFDQEFVKAISQGMPPTGGIGIGIDRLVMLLTNSHSIRDVLFFPWMKPLPTQEKSDE